MKTLRRVPIRAILTIGLVAVALAAAATVLALPSPNEGLRLGYEDGQVVVESVDYGSVAQTSGLRPGQVIVTLDGQNVFSATAEGKQEAARSRGPFGEVMTANRDQIKCDGSGKCTLPPEYDSGSVGLTVLIACSPATPEPSASPPGVGYTCELSQDPSATGYVGPSYLVFGGDGTVTVRSYEYTTIGMSFGGPPEAWHELYRGEPISAFPAQLGLAVFFLGWLMIGRGWAGSTLRPYALTLPVATAVPLIAVTIDRYHSAPVAVLLAVLVPLAVLPLAMDFLGRIEGRRRRWLVACATVGLAVASVAAGLLVPVERSMLYLRPVLVGGIAFVPGLVAARPFGRPKSVSRQGPPWWRSALARAVALVPGRFGARLSGRLESSSAAGSGRSPRALVESFDVLLAALTPGIAAISLADDNTVEVWPILVWLGALIVATRLVLRPLARLATAARRQRDLVVAATEAERARIAADIHDDALQDLSMLVRRLDAAGDTANAQAAREVAERLRSICGDLRLPVLEDLGVGPALEWLCGRMDPSANEIMLDRLGDESRLPADVELAVFRIAQEAISNAIRHGATPIVVRYRARPDWAELEVSDSGRGIAGDSAERAEQAGHLGLLNMTQRAEAIGAGLQIGRRPEGGTRVSLVWDRTAAVAAVAAPEPA